MAIVVVLLLGQVNWLLPGSFGLRFALLGSAVLCGCLVYVASLWLFGVREIQQVWAMFTRRLSNYTGRSENSGHG
jgi:hypothetical protein